MSANSQSQDPAPGWGASRGCSQPYVEKLFPLNPRGLTVTAAAGSDPKPFSSASTLEPSTNARLDVLEAKLNSRIELETLAKLVMSFWLILSVLLALFGISKFSDVDETIDQRVAARLVADQNELADLRDILGQSDVLRDKFASLTEDFSRQQSLQQHIESLGKDVDISGDVQRIGVETNQRWPATVQLLRSHGAEQLDGHNIDYSGTILERGWRLAAIATLKRFSDSEGAFSSDLIFNAVQACRRLQLAEHCAGLAAAARRKTDEAPVVAMDLALQVDSSTGAKRRAAYQELLALVSRLPEDSPQIVLSEGWNAAVDMADFDALIEAIRQGEQSKRYVPSYAFVVKARAIAAASRPSWREDAKVATERARELVAAESPMASWFADSITELPDIERLVAAGGSANDTPEIDMRLLERLLEQQAPATQAIPED